MATECEASLASQSKASMDYTAGPFLLRRKENIKGWLTLPTLLHLPTPSVTGKTGNRRGEHGAGR